MLNIQKNYSYTNSQKESVLLQCQTIQITLDRNNLLLKTIHQKLILEEGTLVGDETLLTLSLTEGRRWDKRHR